MKNFVLPWVILGIGNENVWKTKLERVKTKFTKASDPVEDGERKEFELWMKIFGDDDRDPGGEISLRRLWWPEIGVLSVDFDRRRGGG
ncbi:hypothetical protein L6452_28694 [Arctium lappa]|uniref:Uncharacterized protein n=1 Tax=Arctium lappa TaxID=4217 RepID=A0ACB9A3H6_ARCLA|nr:hypothetical protein L6452_28694 [Arctium lappa]